jgi:hypothetical protein
MFCAAVPVAGAVGAKLNADQKHRPEAARLPISTMTGVAIALLLVCSAVYHTPAWRS